MPATGMLRPTSPIGFRAPPGGPGFTLRCDPGYSNRQLGVAHLAGVSGSMGLAWLYHDGLPCPQSAPSGDCGPYDGTL